MFSRSTFDYESVLLRPILIIKTNCEPFSLFRGCLALASGQTVQLRLQIWSDA